MNERGGSAAPLLSEVWATLIMAWWATSQLVSAHHREKERERNRKRFVSAAVGICIYSHFPHCEKITAQSGFFGLRLTKVPSVCDSTAVARWRKFRRALLIRRVNSPPLHYVIIHAAVVERVKRLMKWLPLFNGLTLKTPISHLTSYSIEQLF